MTDIYFELISFPGGFHLRLESITEKYHSFGVGGQI